MTETLEIQVKQLSLAHLPQIVEVHVQAFPHSATTRLGREVVSRYYEWQFVGPHQAHYLGAWLNDQLGGFCFCGKFSRALGGFLARNRWFLTLQVLAKPWLWPNAEIRSAVVSAVRVTKLRSTSLPVPRLPYEPQRHDSFGILAIAVAPHCRRIGLGARLMNEAEAIASHQRFEAMGLTVEPGNAPAVTFYERLGWKRVAHNGVWTGRMEKSLEGRSDPRVS
jgi:ribosomal protein S18 acetylase RimI-like enzyme